MTKQPEVLMPQLQVGITGRPRRYRTAVVKHVSVKDLNGVVIHNLDEFSVVISVHRVVELAKSDEILTIDSSVGSRSESESLEVDLELGSLNASTKSWLALIDGQEVDACVAVLPETT